MVASVASNAAGCRDGQAHTSHSIVQRGISAEKMARAFETAPRWHRPICIDTSN
ncbi:MAG: hypothetical protein ACJATP_002926 [Candidatus Azotimanducaceae bacterium]|jgi:hypothetical protein